MKVPFALTDRYQVTRHLARGGMADVYEGEDTLLNRKVAIKVLHSQFSADEAFVKRFRREAQAAANLSHPNVVGIYDWGQSETTYFIVMELVEGRSLRDVLRSEGALLPRRATEIAADTAAALSIAHQAGLVHRDVKPGNILLSRDGSVKVTDFGIARAWDDSQELTRTGAVIGTATYFSPEQAQGAAADTRSDVYALGVVLYEMLTGRPPFTGDSPMAVAFQHVSAEAPPPGSLNADVAQSLDAVVTKALCKDPAARYQSAEEMRENLLGVLKGDQVAAPVTPAAAEVATGAATTQVMTSAPPPTVPTDEVYRLIEDEPRSQMPFILTAFGLLVALAILVFFLFQLASGGSPDVETAIVPTVDGLTQDAALARLQADGFDISTVFESSDDAPSGVVIGTNPSGGTETERGATIEVVVSQGSEEFPVPPLIGENVDLARQRIVDAGLVVGTIEFRPDAESVIDIVVDQNPSAGVEVGADTPVHLVVSSGPEEIVLPDLIDLPEREAITLLTDLDLKFSVNEAFSDSIAEGTVVETDPVGGSTVFSGDTVLLVVSLGPEPVTVPDLSGLNEGQAQTALETLGLNLNVSATREPVTDPAQAGLVQEQIPAADSTALPGDTVTVRLGEYIPPPTTAPTSPTDPP